MSQDKKKRSVGIVGARGFVGTELIKLLIEHPDLEISYLGSRSLAGESIGQHMSRHIEGSARALVFEALEPDDMAARPVDLCFLALPNGLAAPYVGAVEAAHPGCAIVDISADYRFSDDWVYGLPELGREALRGAPRISNPGCYATAMQLVLAPLKDRMDGVPSCFGVSGYSGAGTKPSPKNDRVKLRDNLMPYSLEGHLHEREVSHHLGHAVHFMPHVSPLFRGISMTVNVPLAKEWTRDDLVACYAAFYDGEKLVEVTGDMPEVAEIQGRHGCRIGGFALADGGRRVVMVAVLDNLLKGAATQALQNANLALKLDEFAGIDTSSSC